jgi:hypothetical protein
MKINKIKLIESKSERVSSLLSAEISENGDLVLDGQDLGSFVKETFGDYDYEHTLTLKSEYKDTLLLYLLKEKFPNVSTFKEWFNEKEIPNEFWSF